LLKFLHIYLVLTNGSEKAAISSVQVVSLGYRSVAHYLIATKRSSANSDDSSAADSSNKLLSPKSETSCISDYDAPVGKESLEDGETSSKAKVKKNKTTNCQVKKPDGHKDARRSESVVTSDSQDDQANKDAACATPSKPAVPRKRKVIERSPDCVASRLRSRTNKQ
jgi:cell division cycle-associated protein 7